jgi:hypothetical protein
VRPQRIVDTTCAIVTGWYPRHMLGIAIGMFFLLFSGIAILFADRFVGAHDECRAKGHEEEHGPSQDRVFGRP